MNLRFESAKLAQEWMDRLTPQDTDGIENVSLEKAIEKARKDCKEGNCIIFKTHEDIDNYFNSL